MNFRHPVFLTLLAAIILVLIGLYIVERQRAIDPSGTSASWETENGYLSQPETTPVTNDSEPLTPVTQNNGPETLTIPTATTSSAQKPTVRTEGTFDYNAMLAQMRGSARQAR